MDLSFASVSLVSLAGTVFGAGGFYALSNFRLGRVEDEVRKIADIRERLIRIETILIENKAKDDGH